MTTTIQTKFGNATLTKEGYYKITSRKEGNHGKLLHRLVFEDFYKIKLPKGVVIHHNDGDSTNNHIWNLIPLTDFEHCSLHSRNENNNNYGKIPSLKSRIKKSKTDNSTGIFRVSKRFNKYNKQGFTWIYQYSISGKQKAIVSVDLLELKKKVIAKGFEWIIIDKEKALKTLSEIGLNKLEVLQDG